MPPWLAVLPLAMLAGTFLSGCVAVAIPALAGTAIVGTRAINSDESQAAAPKDGARERPDLAPAPIGTELALPAAAQPIPAERRDVAEFVRYSRNIAAARPSAERPGAGGMISAILASPTALDGLRRRCKPDDQPVAVIDLDPQGSIFTPPPASQSQGGTALGLAVLRDAGVVVAWLSDLPIEQAGAVRTALEQSGLDPRGNDIVSLRHAPDDRKQQRIDNLAATACIIAIAGDERADFDERFQYLRATDAGAALEPIIGDGWFLITPIFPIQGPQGQ